MNRWLITLIIIHFFGGCIGQNQDKKEIGKKDGIESLKTNSESKDKVTDDTTSKDTLVEKNQKIKVQKKKLTTSSSIWSGNQLDFLSSIDTIQQFRIITTEIGSRKLEFLSQFNKSEIDDFLEILLEERFFRKEEVGKNKSQSIDFNPKYQFLLVSNGEKLSLLLDVDILQLVIASLTNREEKFVTSDFVEQIKQIK